MPSSLHINNELPDKAKIAQAGSEETTVIPGLVCEQYFFPCLISPEIKLTPPHPPPETELEPVLELAL